MNTMNTQHTPGCWTFDASGDLVSPDFAIAYVMENPPGTVRVFVNNPADARLIASAPDLMAALEATLQALRHAPNEGSYGERARYRAEEALAKAQGTA